MPRVAAIQMCSTSHIDTNLAAAKQLIAEAATQGAQLVVLPEMFPLLGAKVGSNVLIKEELGQGKIQDFLAEQAKAHQIWLVGGTMPIASPEANKAYAACLLYNDQGKLVAHYNKIHLFDVDLSNTESYKESANTTPGTQAIVVDTPFGKLGLGVCYDIRFPELFRYLFHHGAEIIALPAAFTVKTGEAHWEVLCRSRAIENFCYLIGAAQGGEHGNGRKTYGHSMIIDPWGTIIAEKKDTQAGVIYADIDLNKLHEIRKSIPAFQHRKLFSIR